MSQRVCLRAVFESCRPAQGSRCLLRTSTHYRHYASSTDKAKQPMTSMESTSITSPTNKAPPLEIATQNESTDTGNVATTSEPVSASKPVPINVLAALKAPLKHPAPHGVPVASLQLRSYSVRNLEFFADFALRAAYYLNLPASGPVTLPKRRERWTMPRANFVHKKSQENFERITYKRLITVMDGEKSAVEVWLAVLRKWQFWGVGMKANVWEWEGVDVAARMDAQAKDLEAEISAKLANFGFNKTASQSQSVGDLLTKQGIKGVGMPLTEVREGAQSTTSEI